MRRVTAFRFISITDRSNHGGLQYEKIFLSSSTSKFRFMQALRLPVIRHTLRYIWKITESHNCSKIQSFTQAGRLRFHDRRSTLSIFCIYRGVKLLSQAAFIRDQEKSKCCRPAPKQSFAWLKTAVRIKYEWLHFSPAVVIRGSIYSCRRGRAQRILI